MNYIILHIPEIIFRYFKMSSCHTNEADYILRYFIRNYLPFIFLLKSLYYIAY